MALPTLNSEGTSQRGRLGGNPRRKPFFLRLIHHDTLAKAQPGIAGLYGKTGFVSKHLRQPQCLRVKMVLISNMVTV